MVPMRSRILFFASVLTGVLLFAEQGSAQLADETHATTEQSCSFGMSKGEPSQRCAVPFPPGCRVANIPGSARPLATISKGGRVLCRFDEKKTDWKANIVGACGRCQSDLCSAQFSVRFDCSAQ